MRFKELKRLIRTSPLRNSSLYHAFRFEMKKKECNKVIDRFVEGEISSERRRQIVKNMRHAMVKYHWAFDEYFMYNFESLSHKERMEFIPEYEKNIFCARVNDPQKSAIFDSKWNTSKVFHKYYGREVIFLTNNASLGSEDFTKFVNRHKSFIVKPDSEASGRGINILKVCDINDAIAQIKNNYGETFKNLVFEELVDQDDRMGRFHENSVNTVRVRSFRFDDRVEILPCNMRIGQGGAIVDNTGKGGISIALDSSGVAIAACDESGKHYEVHPDSNLPIVGFKVPDWDLLINLVKELAHVVPEVRYVGWDLALSKTGWVLIEGNDKSMFVGIQKTTQKGYRPEVLRILSEMNLHL